MKKVKFEFKYIMIILVVIAGVLLAVSGSFNETKTQTAYKTTVDGTDSTRVAKWEVVGVTRNESSELNLNVGFNEDIKDSGSWYFDVQNKSEVIAKFSNDSKIEFRLYHGSYDNIDDVAPIKWNFLGSKNPITFTITAYPGSATEMLTYQLGDSDPISYAAYKALSVAERKDYKEIFTYTDDPSNDNDNPIVVAKTTGELSFSKSGEADENGTYYYTCSFDMDSALGTLNKLTYDGSMTFKVDWVVEAACSHKNDENNDNICDDCGMCSHVDEEEPNNICDLCGKLVNIDGNYYKYIISNSNSAIAGYELQSGEYVDPSVVPDSEDDGKRYLFKSTNPVEFFEYQKYTSTLGGEPQYKIVTGSNSETSLIGHGKLNEDQRTAIKEYAGNDVQKVWEKFTYAEYDKFVQELAASQDSLSYMAFGAKLQIIFDFNVEQVD